MDYRITQGPGLTEAALSGRLTFNDYEKMRLLMRDLGAAPARHVTLRLDGLEFVDSSGIGMLLIVKEEVEQKDKTLDVRGATGQVLRVLTVADLGKVLDLRP